MLNDPWFYFFLVSLVVGSAWSISRELHIRTLSAAAKRIARNLLKTNETLVDACEDITKEIHRCDDQTKKQLEGVVKLVLDVERRLTDQMAETRAVIRDDRQSLVQVSTGQSAVNQAGENRHEHR